MLTRAEIVMAVQEALEPQAFVHALWEGGSAAFGRLDGLSDIDLEIDVDADKVEEAIALLDRVVAGLEPAGAAGRGIGRRYRLPEPTWHGHAQMFYQLASAGPYLMLDVVVMKHLDGQRFSERELHGEPIVYFDKAGIVQVTNLDWESHNARLKQRLTELAASFPMFQSLVSKEVQRGDALAALSFYQGLCLRPLVELLRIIYDPARHNFHMRYLRQDLPGEAVSRLERICFVADLESLVAAHEEARAWFNELLPLAKAKLGGC